MIELRSQNESKSSSCFALEGAGVTRLCSARGAGTTDESTNLAHSELYFIYVLNYVFCLNYNRITFSFWYIELQAKHRHYLAKRSKKIEKNEEIKAWGPLSELCDSLIGLTITFCSRVLRSEGKDQIGCRMEQLVHRREVSRRSACIPMIQNREMLRLLTNTTMKWSKSGSSICLVIPSNVVEHLTATLIFDNYKCLMSALT